MPTKPIVLAMLICDYYYRDVHTGKSILSGTFSSINSAGFPSKHGNCAIYIAMTDVAVSGEAQLVFRKESGSFSMSMPPWVVNPSDNRRAVVEIGGNINGLPLPEEGEYEFVLLWNGMEVARRRLMAVRINMSGEPEPDPLGGYDPAGDYPM
ncbi:MAG: hypothetical protein LBU70_08210 [Chitinispirillales bacterium]|jgi:hypothetical protein|nr:hypothetical protein [Chitinispirillales bacterium]